MLWLATLYQYLEIYVKFALFARNNKLRKISRESLPEWLCLVAVAGQVLDLSCCAPRPGVSEKDCVQAYLRSV